MMEYIEIERLFQHLGREAHTSDARCYYEIDMLDEEQWVVCCRVNADCDAELAEDRAYSLAKIIERILNEWYPPVEKGWSWHLYGDPNYWTARSQEVYDLANIDDGGCVQWCIFKER